MASSEKQTAHYPLTVWAKVLDVLGGVKGMTVPNKIRFCLGWAGTIAAGITAFVLWQCSGNTRELQECALRFLVFWILVPPMYFWFDYFVLWDVEKRDESSQFGKLDEFKHGQELSRNLWLAIVAVLYAVTKIDPLP